MEPSFAKRYVSCLTEEEIDLFTENRAEFVEKFGTFGVEAINCALKSLRNEK